jgi:hypothetical protein
MIEGIAFDPESVPESLAEPLVYVAMWGEDVQSELRLNAPLRMELLSQVDSSLLGSARAIRPNWFSPSSDRLTSLGALLPQNAAVGAFFLEELSRSRAIALYRAVRNTDGSAKVASTWGVITKEDVASWR